MFGYIRPYKPYLKVYEYDYYKSLYCGLCKQLKKDFGTLSTLPLNYDFVFLALLKISLTKSESVLKRKSCTLNPLNKVNFIENDCIKFVTDILIISSHYKIEDAKVDNGLKNKLFANIASYIILPDYKRIDKNLHYLNREFKVYISEQNKLEKSKEKNLDIIAEPSAICFGKIFKAISNDPKEKKILERMGYFIGRWIYLIDAFDDFEDDKIKNNYNPFIENFRDMDKESLFKNIEPTLNLTIGEIVNCYNLLKIEINKDILDNIIFLGFKNTQLSIKKNKENTHVRSV